jgi:hypothetical protein
MPSVTPNRSNSSQNTAAPFSRDPTGAERQHWELNSLGDNSLFVLQISIISDCGPEARCYRRDHMRLRARAAPVFSQSSARKRPRGGPRSSRATSWLSPAMRSPETCASRTSCKYFSFDPERHVAKQRRLHENFPMQPDRGPNSARNAPPQSTSR